MVAVLGGTATFLRRQIVLVVAVLAALVSVAFVPIDAAYAGYFDWHTLVCLYCTLAAVKALSRRGFFVAVAERVIEPFRGRRALILALVLITGVAAMFVTNDVALLAFLPLSAAALRATGNERWITIAFVLQTAAANLLGMLTPFGSPHNLYVYSHYGIPTGEFLGVTVWPWAIALVLLVGICCCLPGAPIRPVVARDPFSWARTSVELAVFVVAVLVVLKVVPLWVAVLVPLVLLVVDHRAAWTVDWALLGTFVAFFVFSGNLARIPAVETALTGLLSWNVLLVSAASSQVISNVPAAILLAPFTADWRQLLVGVNVGGVGTLIASLASLIGFAQHQRALPGHARRFLGWFTLVNAGLLLVLLAAAWALVAASVL